MDEPGAEEKELPKRFVESLIASAHSKGATHLHIEPGEEKLLVRHRIDGRLHPAESFSLEVHARLLALIKEMAGLDAQESRLPQSGLLLLRKASSSLYCKVEIIPGFQGEKISIALLESARRVELPLAELGLSGGQLEQLRAALHQRSGLIVFTGPPSSGKNTMAYSSLLELAPEERGMASIEAAIRGRLPGVHQTVLQEDLGFNTASALRSLERGDHDVIYVREILDFEIAELCMRRVIFQGRLLLTTLQTNDAASAITRLLDMGVEPWLLSRALRLVQAQRRVRRLCSQCRRETPVDASVLASVGLPSERPLPEHLYTPVGCEHCQGTGYAGKVLLCESLPITPALQERILARASSEALKGAAVSEGMRTLRVAGLERVCEGLTSLDEVLLDTPADAGELRSR